MLTTPTCYHMRVLRGIAQSVHYGYCRPSLQHACNGSWEAYQGGMHWRQDLGSFRNVVAYNICIYYYPIHDNKSRH